MKKVAFIAFVMGLLALLLVASLPAAGIDCGPCQGGCPWVSSPLIELHAQAAPHQGLHQVVQGQQWVVWCVVAQSSDGHPVQRILEGPWTGYYVDSKDVTKPPPPSPPPLSHSQ